MRHTSKILFIVVALAWSGFWTVPLYKEIKTLLEKKVVTVKISGQGWVKVVFSNAQPHHEIIYEMKTDWYPALESQPLFFSGKQIDQPFQHYVKLKLHGYLWQFLLHVVLPISIFGAFIKFAPKIDAEEIKRN